MIHREAASACVIGQAHVENESVAVALHFELGPRSWHPYTDQPPHIVFYATADHHARTVCVCVHFSFVTRAKHCNFCLLHDCVCVCACFHSLFQTNRSSALFLMTGQTVLAHGNFFTTIITGRKTKKTNYICIRHDEMKSSYACYGCFDSRPKRSRAKFVACGMSSYKECELVPVFVPHNSRLYCGEMVTK